MTSKEKEVVHRILRTQLLAIRDLSADCGVARTARLFGLLKTLIELLATASTERVLESIDILIKMMVCLRLDLSRDEIGWLEQALSDQEKYLRPTRVHVTLWTSFSPWTKRNTLFRFQPDYRDAKILGYR